MIFKVNLVGFQHTAARRRLLVFRSNHNPINRFQHTAARRRLLYFPHIHRLGGDGFNTQPPEGGCVVNNYDVALVPKSVSTHSRPKAAANTYSLFDVYTGVSTHSRPKAAATMPCASSPILPFQHTAARRRLLALLCSLVVLTLVSTRSRAKAAALNDKIIRGCSTVSTHSRAKAAAVGIMMSKHGARFQHTAAWRRLRSQYPTY